jgi:heterotetrameric sarcosine oxidase gamma subunit
VADSNTFEMRAGCLLSLRARPGPWLERLAGGLSQLAPCRQLRQAQTLWLRLGPDEWWCWQDGAGADARALQDAIETAAQGQFHACVDLSDAHALCLLGAPAEPLLSSGCDLDIERLPADFAGRSRLGPFTVVLAPEPAQPGAMRLWVEASLDDSLRLWLSRTTAVQQTMARS